jgi:hypothetical protein
VETGYQRRETRGGRRGPPVACIPSIVEKEPKVMRRIVLLAILLLALFYVAWPAFSLHRINTALQRGDADLLAAKVDFDSVRESLRPFAAAEAGKVLGGLDGGGGLGGVLGGEIKGQLQEKAVETILNGMVTPQGAIRMYQEGKSLHEMAKRHGLSDGKGGIDPGKIIGGLFGKKGTPAPVAETPAPAATPATPKHCCGLGNVKGFGLAGARTIWVSLARDNAASEGDARFEMSFTGGDWKLTAVRPKAL